MNDLTDVEKLKYIGYLFAYAGLYPKLENQKYEELAEIKIKFDREKEKILNPCWAFNNYLPVIRKIYPTKITDEIMTVSPAEKPFYKKWFSELLSFDKKK